MQDCDRLRYRSFKQHNHYKIFRVRAAMISPLINNNGHRVHTYRKSPSHLNTIIIIHTLEMNIIAEKHSWI